MWNASPNSTDFQRKTLYTHFSNGSHYLVVVKVMADMLWVMKKFKFLFCIHTNVVERLDARSCKSKKQDVLGNPWRILQSVAITTSLVQELNICPHPPIPFTILCLLPNTPTGNVATSPNKGGLLLGCSKDRACSVPIEQSWAERMEACRKEHRQLAVSMKWHTLCCDILLQFSFVYIW